MPQIKREVILSTVIPMKLGSVQLYNGLANDNEDTEIIIDGPKPYADVDHLVALAHSILMFANVIRHENNAEDLQTHGEFFVGSLNGVYPF